MSVSMQRIPHFTTVRQRLDSFGYHPRMINTTPTISLTKLRPDNDAQHEKVTVHAPTKQGICSFLGPNCLFHEPYCYQTNYVGLGNQTLPMISFGREIIETLEEVKRDFYQNFEPVVRAAYSHGPFMVSRSGPPTRMGRPGLNCGYQLTWPGMADQLHERSAMIGTFREPGTIKVEQWVGVQDMDPITQTLQQTIREQAYYYECPQVFVFDSTYLLIAQLKADNLENLRAPSCPVDHCVIPRQCFEEEQSTIQYGLYALAWRGWMRLSATLLSSPGGFQGCHLLELDGSTRVHEYWSGRPMWKTNDTTIIEHPTGWSRYFYATNPVTFQNTGMAEGHVTGPAGDFVWFREGERWSVSDTGNVFQ